MGIHVCRSSTEITVRSVLAISVPEDATDDTHGFLVLDTAAHGNWR